MSEIFAVAKSLTWKTRVVPRVVLSMRERTEATLRAAIIAHDHGFLLEIVDRLRSHRPDRFSALISSARLMELLEGSIAFGCVPRFESLYELIFPEYIVSLRGDAGVLPPHIKGKWSADLSFCVGETEDPTGMLWGAFGLGRITVDGGSPFCTFDHASTVDGRAYDLTRLQTVGQLVTRALTTIEHLSPPYVAYGERSY